MRIIKPVEVTGSVLTSSTIPEPDTGETEWEAGTYTLGQRRVKSSTHMVYEVVADSTTDDPTGENQGINANPPTWVEVSATNKYRMFDQSNSSASTSNGNIVVEITPGIVAAGVSAFNVSASEAVITMTDPIDGVVYTNTIQLIDNSDIIDAYTYCFNAIKPLDSFTLTDLPAYRSATTKVEFNGANTSVGTLVVGEVLDIGVTVYGTGWQGLNFSKKERDQFGNIVKTSGRIIDRFDYDVDVIPASRFNYVRNQLKALNDIPCVFIGDPSNPSDAKTVYGYYYDADINIPNPAAAKCSITVEEL